MTESAIPAARPGRARSALAAETLATYNRYSQLPIVLAAVLPLVIAPAPGHPVSIVVSVVSWLVFVADLVVHLRLLERYLATGLGLFDLGIVIVTAPWFLLPGAQTASFVVVLRLARLARLVVASKGARRLLARLGRVAVVAGSVTVIGALVEYYAEHPSNPEFATVGDALWWAVVTVTTVGYGDITPITLTGRLVAAMIMITGVSVLGVLAGTLASFFGLENGRGGRQSSRAPAAVEPGPAPGPGAEPASPPGPGATAERGDRADLDAVLTELGELRDSLDSVTGRLSHFSEGRLTADRGPVPPPDGTHPERGRPPGG